MKIRVGVAAAALMVSATGGANATVLASNSTGSSSSTSFAGQSFTVLGTGSFDNISFSFFNGSNAVANGILSIFSAAVIAGPTSASTLTTNLVGRSIGTSNGAYLFDSSVTLVGGTKYYAYANVSQTLSYSSTDVLTGGNRYSSSAAGTTYSSSSASDYKFSLTAVPEPASWAMMLGGFGLVGASLRRRRAKISFG